MKRLFFCIVLCCNLITIFAENQIFALQAKDKTVYCFQFDSGISLFIDFPLAVKGYSDFNSSFLLSFEDDNMLVFGKVPLTDFLSKKNIIKYSDSEKIEAYYQWEKKYQEDECNNVFTDEIKLENNENIVFGYYKFFRNIPITEIKETETVATEGIVFVYGNYVVYVNKIILKKQDHDKSKELLYLAFDSLKVTMEVFEPEDGWDIYSKL